MKKFYLLIPAALLLLLPTTVATETNQEPSSLRWSARAEYTFRYPYDRTEQVCLSPYYPDGRVVENRGQIGVRYAECTGEIEATTVLEQPALTIPPDIQNDPPPIKNDQPEPEKKQRCDKGGGNGSEGCDPGKKPDKGNDDEGG